MKKTILAALAAVFISTGAFAQNTEFGIRAGFNLADLTGDEKVRFRTGIHIGPLVEFTLGKYLGLQAALLYSQQGKKYKYGSNNIMLFSAEKGVLRMDYINLPIMLRILLGDGGGKSGSFDIGPQFGYLVNSDILHAKKFDFSIAVGFSPRLSDKTNLSFRYNIGLTGVKNKQLYEEKIRNNVIQFGFNFKF